jgi:CheY-like chemotaxis protein
MSIKLLLADDSITIQKVISIIFGGEDYSLTVVDNGEAAVEKAREINPDVLLIDALMPGMSGYEVCEAVRATPALADKPILLLTGSFEPFDEDRAKKCGADDFMAKPFESQQIINKIKELAELGASRAADTVVEEPAATSEPVAPFAVQAETIYEPEPPIQTEAPQATASSDIWGAFIPDPEPSQDAAVMPEPAYTELSESFEPDVFAIINEDSDSQPVQSVATSSSPNQSQGTDWIPVSEQTFEFEAENVVEIPGTAFSEVEATVVEPGLDEIIFEDETPARQPAVTAAETFSEEQLKAAISAVSKEVIERIVWEVVPDLAESMIREAIRKIKDGV